MKTILSLTLFAGSFAAANKPTILTPTHPQGWICPEGTQKAVCGGTYCCEPKLQDWLKVM